MSKIYLSRSISRTLSADHPVGDPTGGAAYGEKNDPISAMLSIATMAGTYAQIGTTITLMQGLTMAGAALSLVGNVTGNKTLSKIGMVAGITGGLGQMGAFGDAAKGATWGSTFGGGGTAPSSSLASATIGNQTPVKSGVQTGSTTVAGDGNRIAAYGQSSSANAPPATGGAPGVANQTNVGGAIPQPNVVPTAPSTIATAGTDGSNYASNVYNQSLSPAGPAFSDVGPGYTAPESSFMSEAWQGTKDFLNPVKNPYGAMAVGQVAQPIADYLSGKTDAEIDALEAQTRANEATAGYTDERTQQLKEEIAREKARRQNLNVGYSSVDAGITVNPNAYANQQGLIAQQMQPAT